MARPARSKKRQPQRWAAPEAVYLPAGATTGLVTVTTPNGSVTWIIRYPLTIGKQLRFVNYAQ
jgi:hypothetical protein